MQDLDYTNFLKFVKMDPAAQPTPNRKRPPVTQTDNTAPREHSQRRWLVRVDPEVWRDEQFCGHLNVAARYAYFDSLFFLAAGDGPDGIYPLATCPPCPSLDPLGRAIGR